MSRDFDGVYAVLFDLQIAEIRATTEAFIACVSQAALPRASGAADVAEAGAGLDSAAEDAAGNIVSPDLPSPWLLPPAEPSGFGRIVADVSSLMLAFVVPTALTQVNLSAACAAGLEAAALQLASCGPFLAPKDSDSTLDSDASRRQVAAAEELVIACLQPKKRSSTSSSRGPYSSLCASLSTPHGLQ